MLVAVDVNVARSKRRWLYVSAIVISAAVMLFSIFISPWWSLSSLIIYWLAHLVWQSELQCDFLSFRGVDVIVSDAGEPKKFSWRGRSVRSHAFIRLTLLNDESERADLTIWRDSITADNWRALNMAIRVHEAQAKAEPS